MSRLFFTGDRNTNCCEPLDVTYLLVSRMLRSESRAHAMRLATSVWRSSSDRMRVSATVSACLKFSHSRFRAASWSFTDGTGTASTDSTPARKREEDFRLPLFAPRAPIQPYPHLDRTPKAACCLPPNRTICIRASGVNQMQPTRTRSFSGCARHVQNSFGHRIDAVRRRAIAIQY
jgi:hypothetical protein